MTNDFITGALAALATLGTTYLVLSSTVHMIRDLRQKRQNKDQEFDLSAFMNPATAEAMKDLRLCIACGQIVDINNPHSVEHHSTASHQQEKRH